MYEYHFIEYEYGGIPDAQLQSVQFGIPSSQRSDGLEKRELAQRDVATAATRRCVRLASIASFDVV